MKVFKVGSDSLHDGVSPRIDVFDLIAQETVGEMNNGGSVAIVSSAACKFGRVAMRLDSRDLLTKQVQSTVGQPILMAEWQRAFTEHDKLVGQVLVTNHLIQEGSKESKVLLETVYKMFSMGIVPIINENDAVSAEEIIYGDNDQLAAHVAKIIGAETLHLLGTEDAFFENYHGEKNVLKK
ncbi:MAG: hypothetical protein M3Q70_01210 [bacterium]|nr:hypothetical protein [bacterium]